jgi:hypothetical protein
MKRSLDLDVDSPEKVSMILRNAAEAYYESALELSSAWQEKSAGKPWEIIARVLARAADEIDKKL